MNELELIQKHCKSTHECEVCKFFHKDCFCILIQDPCDWEVEEILGKLHE